jgi:hypothetical protein
MLVWLRQALDVAVLVFWIVAIAVAAAVLCAVATARAAARRLRRVRYQD